MIEDRTHAAARGRTRKSTEWHWIYRYGLAVVLFAVTLGLSRLLSSVGLSVNLTIPIVLSLAAAAWYGGLGPGLLISILFQATTIIFVPIPAGSSVAKAVFGYFSVFSLLVFLSFMLSRLRNIQDGLRESRDLLQVTLSSIAEAVIATDPGGVVTFVNPAAERLTRVPLDKALGSKLTELFRIVNEDTREEVKSPAQKVIETGQAAALANHSILITRDGHEVPIDDSAAPIMNKGIVQGVVLVITDATERKLAERSRREREMMERVVEAQEGERRRIARDLHDHLGQLMTALRLRIEALSEKCTENLDLKNAIGSVQASAMEIDRDISFLSWELRPTELEDLGLGDALKSFLREWSTQYGISAEFQASKTGSGADGGRLPHAVETNLYRIAQEALNNVLKHSGADRVNVLLQHKPESIVLIVEDNGEGFDSEEFSSSMTSPGGLGLVGMLERAAILKGTLEIDSAPGKGTSVRAEIPLEVAELPALHAAAVR